MGRTTVLLSKSCQLFFLLIFHVFGKWNSAICVLHYMSQLSGITMRLQINTKPSNSSQNLSPKSFAPRQNSLQNSHPYLASKHSNRLKVYLGMKVQVKSFYKLFFCLWKNTEKADRLCLKFIFNPQNKNTSVKQVPQSRFCHRKKQYKNREAKHEFFLSPNTNVQQVSQSLLKKSTPPYSVAPFFPKNISISWSGSAKW